MFRPSVDTSSTTNRAARYKLLCGEGLESITTTGLRSIKDSVIEVLRQKEHTKGFSTEVTGFAFWTFAPCKSYHAPCAGSFIDRFIQRDLRVAEDDSRERQGGKITCPGGIPCSNAPRVVYSGLGFRALLNESSKQRLFGVGPAANPCKEQLPRLQPQRLLCASFFSVSRPDQPKKFQMGLFNQALSPDNVCSCMEVQFDTKRGGMLYPPQNS